MEPAVWIGPAIVAAFIAGLINVIGWFVTSGQTRRFERERRGEKVVDIQTALLAEIRSDLNTLENFDPVEKLSVLTEMLDRAPAEFPYIPFVPKDSGSPVFLAIIGQITVVPTDVIDPVVLYYKQKESIAHLTDDLRGSSFTALPADRKLAVMKDYLNLKAYAARLAQEAVSALETSLRLPPSINKTVGDQSGRKSALAPVAGIEDEERRSA